MTLGFGSLLPAAAQPEAADRPDRQIQTLDGITIEYSPGDDAYVAPLAQALAAWRRELAARPIPPPEVLPLSAADLRAHRDQILQTIAAAIGLDQATELQAACYDAFLSYYVALSELHDTHHRLTAVLADADHVALWRRAELVGRLQAGESIDGLTYDAAKDEVAFNFGFKTAPDEEAGNPAAAMDAARLDHGLNYEVKDGIAHLSGRVSFRPGQSPGAVNPFDPKAFREKIERGLAELNLVLPVRMEREGKILSPEEIVAAELATRREFAASAQPRAYWDGALALVVLHETIEVGLLERYIGSADRRWWCDGVANYVAWSIARRRGGEATASGVYDLPEQLSRHAAWQKQIRLERWLAVERLSEQDCKSPLDQAHYPFATRAIARLAELHGEDIIAQICREAGRTPREKVTMKTIDAAYRRLTGKRLSDLVRYAEKTPIPAVARERTAAVD